MDEATREDLQRDIDDVARYIDLLHNIGNTVMYQGVPTTVFLNTDVRNSAKLALEQGHQPAVVWFAVHSYLHQYGGHSPANPGPLFRSILRNKTLRDRLSREVQ